MPHFLRQSDQAQITSTMSNLRLPFQLVLLAATSDAFRVTGTDQSPNFLRFGHFTIRNAIDICHSHSAVVKVDLSENYRVRGEYFGTHLNGSLDQMS